MVILVAGKAGAGKTTYANRLAEELLSSGHKVRVLDGDEQRKAANNQDFSEAGRYRHLMSMARSASEAERLGYVVIVAAIAPRIYWREKMRSMWRESLLVYLPGGTLWEGTEFEKPRPAELGVKT